MTTYGNYIYVEGRVNLQADKDFMHNISRDVQRAIDSRQIATDSDTYIANGDDILDATALRANEIQLVVIDATGGTFKLSYGGVLTANVAYNASAATLETALKAIPALAAGNVVVGGTAPTYVVEFLGTLSYYGGINGSSPTALSQGAGTALTGGAGTATVTIPIALGTQQA
jgi:hypothetical protein